MADTLFREQLLSVQGWLAQYESGDDAAVLDERAVAAASQLAASTAVDAALARRAREALALFWWHRFWALPPGQNLSELRLALDQAAGPQPEGGQLPAGLAALLAADPGLTGEPRDWAERATEALSDEDSGPQELTSSIELLRVASQATEAGTEERGVFLANEASVRGQKYGLTGLRADLDDAIEAARIGLAALGDHQDAFLINGNLAMLLRARFGATGAAADIDEAITAGRAAAARESPHQAILLSGLGIALRLRFNGSGGAADLDEAIEAGRAAAAAMPAAEPERTVTLDNLAQALLTRFGRGQSPADLDEAIEAARAAAGIPGGRNIASALSTLVSALGARLDLRDDPADLEDAIAAARALTRLGGGQAEYSGERSRLALLLRMRFMRLGEVADLAAAVALRREVLAVAGDDQDDRVRLQFDLAVELGIQAGTAGTDRDLREAILLFATALGPDPAAPAAGRPRLRAAAARLSAWADTGDAGVLLDPGLTAVLADLATVDPRNPPDLSALCLAGWLYLLRYRFAGQEEKQAELLAAAAALHPVYLVAPIAVPVPVASLYERDEHAAPQEPGGRPSPPGNDEYERVNAAALRLMDRYAASGDLGLLRAAVSGFRQATAVADDDAESVAVAHNNLTLALMSLAQLTDDPDDISGAVAAGRVAVENSAPGQPYLPGRMSLLCGALTLLGGATRDRAVLGEAIEVGRDGLAITPAGHPSRAKYLSNLAMAHFKRHEIGVSDSGAADADGDLREAVSLLRQALEAESPGERDRSARLLNLGAVLEALSERTRDVTTLTESVELTRDALASGPPDPVRLLLLERLGSALAAVYGQTGEPERLAEAIEASRAAVTGTPAGDPAHARRMGALISQANRRYLDTGGSRARREVVGLLRDHTGTLPDTDPVKAAFLALLGLLLPDLTTADDQAVLAEAAAALRAAVALTPRESPEFGRYSMNLADALTRQYQQTSAAVLAEAADAARDAARAPAETEAELRDRLRILINILRTRYETTGDPAELDEAIGAAERGLAAGGDVEWQMTRAELMFIGAAGTGQATRMREAVTLVREVIAQPGADRQHAANAGAILSRLYQFTGALEDLDEAIGLLRLSVGGDDSDQWVAKNTLAGALELRYGRTGEVAALSEAVEMSRSAAASIPPTYAYRSLYLSNLGQLLGELSAVTGDVPLLVEGVDAARASVLAARAAPAYRADHLAALSQLLLRLYGQVPEQQVLTEAVQAGREAVSDSQQPTANRAKHLVSLGSALLRQHASDGNLAALTEACGVLPRAAAQPAASLGDRLTAARMWGQAAMLAADPAQALRGYEYALDLLLQRVGPELAQGDREYGIEESAGLPGEAAAAAIAAGDLARAVELLEHGRGILLGEALHFRSDMSQLAVLEPGLATEFRRIGGQLSALRRQPSGQPMPGPQLSTGAAPAPAPAAPPGPRAAERRAVLAAEFAQIAERIRAVPGFADFMRVPALDTLRDGIGPGPVAMVNASRWRCDALIVTAGGVDVVPLPSLTLQGATERVNEYLAAIQAQQWALQEVLWLRQQAAGPGADPAIYHRYHAAKVELSQASEQMERTLLATMTWLWDAIAEPVLTRLGHTSRPAAGAAWPRIWWCPTGPLTLLPLHAAARREPAAPGARQGPAAPRARHEPAAPAGRAGDDRAVIERAVSSYAPSLRALIEARRPVPGPADDDPGMLIVAMPQTAGQAALPNAERERDLLGRLFPGHATMLTGAAATVPAVLAALSAHRWAHFSCHGDQDLAAPSRGGLLLADGILSVADIGGEHYRGEFAFLSACKTGTGGVTLMDEAITLAAALQYAGYRHVVATSWSVYDAAAADVAERVYHRLAGNGLLRPEDTAVALHAAIRPLRDLFPDRPSVWMPFTHLGS